MLRHYSIPLDPFTRIRESAEVDRASRARKHTKVKRVTPRFVSVNNMYPINRRTGSKYLSTEGRLYKQYINDQMRIQDMNREVFPLGDVYEVSYVFFMSQSMMYCRDGSLRDVDLSNMIKAAEDAIFEYLFESDSRVIRLHGYKRLAQTQPKLVVLISDADPTLGIVHDRRPISFAEIENGSLL